MEHETDPSEIREEIEATRARIAETAEALAYKTDVPARVHDEIDHRVETASVVIGDAAAKIAATVVDGSRQLAATSQTLAESAVENAREFTEIAKERLEDASERVSHASADVDLRRAAVRVRDKPVALGIAGVAAAFVVGSLVARARKKRGDGGSRN